MTDICSAPVPGGCSRPARTMGLCDAHYKRQRTGASVCVPIRGPTPKTALCTAPRCDRTALCRGLCSPHYDRLRHGNASMLPLRPRRTNPTTCRVCRVATIVGRSGYICSACDKKERWARERSEAVCANAACRSAWTATAATRQKAARGEENFCSLRCYFAVHPRVDGSLCQAPVPGGCCRKRQRGRSLCVGHLSRKHRNQRLDTPIVGRWGDRAAIHGHEAT